MKNHQNASGVLSDNENSEETNTQKSNNQNVVESTQEKLAETQERVTKVVHQGSGSTSSWRRMTIHGHILIYLGNGRTAQASYLNYTATTRDEVCPASGSGLYHVHWDSRTYRAYYFTG